MRLRYIVVTAAVVTFLTGAGRAENAVQPAAQADTPPMRWLDTELFSVEIPVSWKEVEGPRLAASRAEAERIAGEIFPPELVTGVPLDRVLWLSAFESDDKSTQLLLSITEIPPPEGAGRAYVAGKILGYADWQRSKELVEQVRASDLEELNGMPAVEVTLDMPDGATVYTVHLWTSVYRDRLGTVIAKSAPGDVAPVKALLLQLLSTIKPSKEVAAAQQAGFRNWLRGKIWLYEGQGTSEALILRIMVVLVTFTLCFAISLRLLYEAILVWYRWRKLEERAIEAARRAARDALRIGYFYSERLTMTCALLSMTVTTAAVAWLAAAP